MWPVLAMAASRRGTGGARRAGCDSGTDEEGGGQKGRNHKTITCQKCVDSCTKTYQFEHISGQSYRGIQSGEKCKEMRCLLSLQIWWSISIYVWPVLAMAASRRGTGGAGPG